MARQKTRRAQGFSVFPRRDGRWGWAVTTGYSTVTGNAKRIQGICRTQQEASEAAVSAVAKFRSGASIPEGRDRALGDFLDEWLELYVRPHRAPKTARYYEGMVEHHIKPVLGHVGMRKLTPKAVQRLINEKMEPTIQANGTVRTLSPETIRGIRATLSSALTQAQRNREIVENAARLLTLPKRRQKTSEYLAPADAQKLLRAAMDHPLGGLIALTLHTGLRLGEVTGLTWGSVDQELGTLRIVAQLQRVGGKLQLKPLKTNGASRKLHLSETAAAIIETERVRQRESIKPGENPLDLVFLNPEGRPLDPKYVNDHLGRIMGVAGLKPVSFHKLRHTAATLALANGVPITVVRDMLGHSQISLTANLYGHAVPSALKQASETLDRIYRFEAMDVAPRV